MRVDTFRSEESKLFMRTPGVAPLGPCGGYKFGGGALQGKMIFFCSLCKMLGQILSKLGRNDAHGQGMPNCSNGTCSLHGGRGRGPQGANCKFQTSSSPDPEQESHIVLFVDNFINEELMLLMTSS